jgi:hypothetical protein
MQKFEFEIFFYKPLTIYLSNFFSYLLFEGAESIAHNFLFRFYLKIASVNAFFL